MSKYVVANWKMNMSAPDVLSWVNSFSVKTENVKVVIAPSYIHIPLLNDLQNKHTIELSGQDACECEKGAHTGFVGAFQLKEFCKYCIIGHSERNENTKTKILKRDACLKNDIVPIVCFTNPKEVSKIKKDGIILAWEDPSNISKNGEYREKPIEEITKGTKKIRKLIDSSATLLYGGSVNRQNIHKLVEIEDLDGILVGNASLDSTHFIDLINAYEIHGR